MTTVHTVFVQLRPPKNGDQGRVIEGAYTLVDGVVTLTNRKGEPACDGDGKRYVHKLKDGENARVIAGRLTRQLRDALKGSSGSVAGFGQPISYPRIKVA